MWSYGGVCGSNQKGRKDHRGSGSQVRRQQWWQVQARRKVEEEAMRRHRTSQVAGELQCRGMQVQGDRLAGSEAGSKVRNSVVWCKAVV